MAIADELIGLLGYKIEGEENLKKYQDGLDKTEQGAEASAARMRKIGMAAGAVAAAGVAFTGAAVKDWAAFEREMTRIGITAEASAIETAAASEEVQRLAGDLALPLGEAVSALDTLVASGMDLEEAMSFLPSVLATAQASGAAATDIANTAQKAASALGLEAEQMQRAFDIMVSGGKAGQFELRDMAQYIPELANLFASLGYSGEDGLQKLIALLQTVREDTGTASGAATQLRNVFAKMNTEQTAKAFEEFGIDLREDLEQARAAGEDVLDTFINLSRQAIDGDLSKLPLLFRDQEFLLGMQSLITSGESFERFMAAVNNADLDGTVFRDLNTVLGDTQASIDRVSNSWDRFIKTVGSSASGPVGSMLDYLTSGISRQDAITKSLEEDGYSFWERQFKIMSNEEANRRAREQGWVAQGDREGVIARENAPYAYEVLGRMPRRPTSTGGVRALEAADQEDAQYLAETYGAQVGFDLTAKFEEGLRKGRFEGSNRRMDAAREAQAAEPELPPIDPNLSFGDRFRESTRRTFDAGVFKMDRKEEKRPTFETMLAGMEDAAKAAAPIEVPISAEAQSITASVETEPVDISGNVGPIRVPAVLDLSSENVEALGRSVSSASIPAPFAASSTDDTRMQELSARIESMNAHLAQMTGQAPVDAVITDARQDNRQFPVNSSVTINQTVNEAQAPMAAAQATGRATSDAVGQAASRMPARAAAGASRP